MSVIPGPRSTVEVEENVRMMEYPIPEDLWRELRELGVFDPEAPTPSVP